MEKVRIKFTEKFAYFLAVIFPFFLNAQILDEFPENQDFYKNGITALYSKIHEIAVRKDLKACADRKEIYHAKILLTKENQIKFITDFDSVTIQKNKCAYDFTLSVLKNLKDDSNWQAATVNGKKYDAVVRFFVVPEHIANYREQYNPYHFYIPPTYKTGLKKQKKDIEDNFMAIFQDFHVNGSLWIDFVIDENGDLTNPIITPEPQNEIFRQRLTQSLKRLNGKWNPAVLDGIPVKARMTIPLTFSINFNER
jgi:hypothetical protein